MSNPLFDTPTGRHRIARLANEDEKTARKYRRWSYWLKTVSIAVPAIFVIGGVVLKYVDWPFADKTETRAAIEEVKSANQETLNEVRAMGGKIDVILELLKPKGKKK